MIEQLDDPLLTLWKEWNRLDAEKEARREDASETEMIGWGKRREEIGKQMAKHVPLTPESAAVLVQLLTYWSQYELFPSDDQQQRILKNLLTWIEGMDGVFQAAAIPAPNGKAGERVVLGLKFL